jgi:hypothetical protein
MGTPWLGSSLVVGVWQIFAARTPRRATKAKSHVDEPELAIELSAAVQERTLVQIVLFATGERVEAQIPLDALLSHVVLALVDKLGLPSSYEGGRRVPYQVDSVDRKVTLNSGMTVRQNSIVPGKLLALRAEYLAG